MRLLGQEFSLVNKKVSNYTYGILSMSKPEVSFSSPMLEGYLFSIGDTWLKTPAKW